MSLDYILVIDDNRHLRTIMDSTLVSAGYFVRGAASGHEGIQMVIDQRPDLIVCDVKMPGMDGYQTLEAVRRCAATASIPFILITGSLGSNDFRHGMACGADDYLSKPFTQDDLKLAVRSRLARRTEIQTEILRRMELDRPGGVNPFANESAAEIAAGHAKAVQRLRAAEARQKLEIPEAPVVLPVFCLD